jgi:transposase
VNQAIAELLVRLNERPFRKRPGSRATLFAQLDRPALKPLAATRFQFGEWETARVNIDYHIEVGRHFYSVPYALVHQEVDVHLTAETVEVLHRGVRVASHIRSDTPAKATSLSEHMPKAHQRYLGRTPSTLIEDAQQVGPSTGQLVEAILQAKRHPEQGYRSCLGILRLAKTYPPERMEAAARRCLRARVYNFQSMDSILKNQLDEAAGPRRSASAVRRRARQHPRRRVLRRPAGDRPSGNSVSPKENHAQPTNDREVVRHAHARHGRRLYATAGRPRKRSTRL